MLALFVITISLLGSACSSFSTAHIRIGNSRAAQIAKDTSIPGKGVQGQCLRFATALHEKFQAEGIPSQVVVYGYQTSGMPETNDNGNRAAHAIVVYSDGGQTYVMDNQSWNPQLVRDGTTREVAQRFSGMNCEVKMAHAIIDSSPTTLLASWPDRE